MVQPAISTILRRLIKTAKDTKQALEIINATANQAAPRDLGPPTQ